jgi:hypothetical protein
VEGGSLKKSLHKARNRAAGVEFGGWHYPQEQGKMKMKEQRTEDREAGSCSLARNASCNLRSGAQIHIQMAVLRIYMEDHAQRPPPVAPAPFCKQHAACSTTSKHSHPAFKCIFLSVYLNNQRLYWGYMVHHICFGGRNSSSLFWLAATWN